MDKEVRILVQAHKSRDSEFFHITGTPVYLDYEDTLNPGTPVVKTFSDSWLWTDKTELGLASLRVEAQGDVNSTDPVYAWKVEYQEPYRVDLTRAKAMASTLGRIESRLEKMRANLGREESFAQFLVRVGLALKADSFGFESPRGDGMWASGEQYRWVGAEQVNGAVHVAIDSLRTKYGVVR